MSAPPITRAVTIGDWDDAFEATLLTYDQVVAVLEMATEQLADVVTKPKADPFLTRIWLVLLASGTALENLRADLSAIQGALPTASVAGGAA